MQFRETKLKGAFVITPEPREDERGLFARVWCQREFEAHGLNPNFVQTSVSYNNRRGTLRGLHYQASPFEEAKLVSCVRGGIYDVIVDLRPESATFLQWVSVTLTADNRTRIYIPEGFAHGFQTLEDSSEALYTITQFHTPDAGRGMRWDDPALGIEWPAVSKRVISPRDNSWDLWSHELHRAENPK